MIIRIERPIQDEHGYGASELVGIMPLEEHVHAMQSAWLAKCLRPRLEREHGVGYMGLMYREECIVIATVRGKNTYPYLSSGGCQSVEEFHRALIADGLATTIEHEEGDLYRVDGEREYHWTIGLAGAPGGWAKVAAARVAREQSHAQARKVAA